MTQTQSSEEKMLSTLGSPHLPFSAGGWGGGDGNGEHSSCSASLLSRCSGEGVHRGPVAWKRSEGRASTGWGKRENLGDMYMEVPASIIAVGALFLEALSSVPRTHAHTNTHTHTSPLHLSVQVDNGLYEWGGRGAPLALG